MSSKKPLRDAYSFYWLPCNQKKQTQSGMSKSMHPGKKAAVPLARAENPFKLRRRIVRPGIIMIDRIWAPVSGPMFKQCYGMVPDREKLGESREKLLEAAQNDPESFSSPLCFSFQ